MDYITNRVNDNLNTLILLRLYYYNQINKKNIQTNQQMMYLVCHLFYTFLNCLVVQKYITV